MTIDKPKGNDSIIFVIVGGILVALIVCLVMPVAMRQSKNCKESDAPVNRDKDEKCVNGNEKDEVTGLP